MIRQCVLLVVLVACGTVGSESETGTPPDGVTDVLLGQPDPDFGDGGVRLVAPSDEWNRGQDIARMRDDRLVVVGDGGRDGVSYGLVAAFTPDGVLDTAFGDDGVVWAGNPYTNLWLGGVTIDAQGRILAVGTLRFLTEYSGVVVRLHPDGSSDGAFGDGGVLPQCCDRVGEGLGFVDVATQSDGTILAAGNRAGSSWCHGVVVALDRYGDPEPSFGEGGRVDLALGTGSCVVGAVTVDLHDQVLLVASTIPDQPGGPPRELAITRLSAKGERQPHFGRDGTARIAMGDDPVHATSVVVDARGRIVAAGYAAGTLAEGPRGLTVRLTPDGRLDETFDGGLVELPNVTITSTVVHADGGIVVVGQTACPDLDVFVARLRPDGTLDRTFGEDGAIVVGEPGQDELAVATVAQATPPRLVVLGSAMTDERASLYLLGLE